jgi:hypothetical protein
MSDNRLMKDYEIVSIEGALGKYWVITYIPKNGQQDKETVEAYDSTEAFIKFRNLMIQRAKKKLPTKKHS